VSEAGIRGATCNFITVKIEKPDDINSILGQTHFIKSVEDIHEALVAAVPGIKFGLAFAKPLANVLCAGPAPIAP